MLDAPPTPPAPGDPASLALHRPRLRGRLHLAAVPAALVGLVWLATQAPTGTARAAAIVYGLAAVALYAVSASYHVFARSPRTRQVLQRLDHATIYIAIAGTYTPVCLLALDGTFRVALLAAVWAGAVAGAVLRLTAFDRCRRFASALYLVLGWAAVVALPALSDRPGLLALLVTGGVLYTIGAILFALRWPRPDARWFGFHEVWHSFGVAAGAVLFAANATLVSAG